MKCQCVRLCDGTIFSIICCMIAKCDSRSVSAKCFMWVLLCINLEVSLECVAKEEDLWDTFMKPFELPLHGGC